MDSKCIVVVTHLQQMDISDWDTDGTAVLQYGRGRRAVLNYAMDKFYDQTATIMGTKGVIKVRLSGLKKLVINHRPRLVINPLIKIIINWQRFPDKITDWLAAGLHRLT